MKTSRSGHVTGIMIEKLWYGVKVREVLGDSFLDICLEFDTSQLLDGGAYYDKVYDVFSISNELVSSQTSVQGKMKKRNKWVPKKELLYSFIVKRNNENGIYVEVLVADKVAYQIELNDQIKGVILHPKREMAQLIIQNA